jgi:hypothetical protein
MSASLTDDDKSTIAAMELIRAAWAADKLTTKEYLDAIKHLVSEE